MTLRVVHILLKYSTNLDTHHLQLFIHCCSFYHLQYAATRYSVLLIQSIMLQQSNMPTLLTLPSLTYSVGIRGAMPASFSNQSHNISFGWKIKNADGVCNGSIEFWVLKLLCR